MATSSWWSVAGVSSGPFRYHLLGTPVVKDIVAPKSLVLQVRANFVNSVDASDGRTYQLQTIERP
jgi:hypothetical protein